MPQTIQLNQNSGWITLGTSGIRLQAPTLKGSVIWSSPAEHSQLMLAAAPAAVDPFEQALREAGLADQGSATFPVGTQSAVAGKNTLVFDQPQDPNQVEFAIYRDENGIVSLHRPLPSSPPTAAMLALAVPGVPPPARLNHYSIPLRNAAPKVGAVPMAMLGGIAGKVIRFVGRAVLNGVLGDAVYVAAKLWEDHYRAAQGIHESSTPALLLANAPTPLANWGTIQGNKSLLFIHGTTSCTSGAFSGLTKFPAAPTSTSLYAKYANRVIGFNHHTLTKSVAQNAVDFLSQLPPANYQFDIICHSRGGLVARALNELTPAQVGQMVTPVWNPPAGLNVQIGKTVLVGVPNQGTPLANPHDLPDAVSRLASIATSLPGGIAAFGLGALLAIFGGIVESGVGALPGLEDMNPGNPFLNQLNAASTNIVPYFAIEANYQPSGGLAEAIENDGVDALFQSAENDLVVPTLGVSNLNGQTLPGGQTDTFAQSANVYHTIYFDQQETWDKILAFLL
jgi:pimeloyl-ACP methyl ester carboxylesterase